MIHYYTGRRIFRTRNPDFSNAEFGDVNFESEGDMPELISKVRFLLSDVIMWEEEKDLYFPFKKAENTLWVRFKNAPSIIIVESIDYFDALMDDYLKS